MKKNLRKYIPNILYFYALLFYKRKNFRTYAQIIERLPIQECGIDETLGKPFVRLNNGKIFYGFFPSKHFYRQIYFFLNKQTKKRIPFESLKCALRIAWAYTYPHADANARPDFCLDLRDALYHGQHADTIFDLPIERKEKATLEKIFRIQEDDIILDIGAHTGLGAIAISELLGPNGHIYSIEADPDSFEILKLNIEKNNITNITPIHIAISDKKGITKFYQGGYQANSLVPEVIEKHGSQDKKEHAFTSVKTTTIDELIQEIGSPKITLLSATINGAELFALRGASHLLKTSESLRVILPGWYEYQGEKIHSQLTSFLRPLGYTCYVGRLGKVIAYK